MLESETGKHGKALKYKSYRGKHWSMRAYPVVKLVDNVHQEKYYVNGQWRMRDKLLKVPGVDRLSRAEVVQKHRHGCATTRDFPNCDANDAKPSCSKMQKSTRKTHCKSRYVCVGMCV